MPASRLVYTVAHGFRTPGTIKCTTCWLFHRNCPPGRLRTAAPQFFQHLGLPRGLLAGRKTLAREVPLLAQHLPGHHVFGLLLARGR